MKIRGKLIAAFLTVAAPLLGLFAVDSVAAGPVHGVVSLACGLVSMGIAVALGCHFGSRIERALSGARSLSKRSLGKTGRPRSDEITLLVEAFAGMADRLRRRESELEAHRSRVEDVLRVLPEGVCVSWDPDGRSVTLNRAAEELLDFRVAACGTADDPAQRARDRHSQAPSGSQSRVPQSAIRNPQSWKNLALVQKLLAHSEPCQTEVVVPHRSGRKVTVQVTTTPTCDRSGQVTGSVAVVRDMSAVKENEARLRTAWEEERQIAEALQQSFVPRVMPAVPEFDFGDDYRPARQRERVGGDFYDVLPLDAGRLAFCIGDVSGKGLEAALSTAMAKNMWRGFLSEDSRPGPLMERLNDAFDRYMEPEHFVTMVCGVADRHTGELQYAVAGHPSPLLRRASGECEALPGTGMVLGAMPGLRYETEETRLEVGDLLLLYTDGMSELRREREMLEVEGLQEWLRTCPAEAPADVVKALYEHARDWSGDRIHDDVALVAIRCRLLSPAASAAPPGEKQRAAA